MQFKHGSWRQTKHLRRNKRGTIFVAGKRKARQFLEWQRRNRKAVIQRLGKTSDPRIRALNATFKAEDKVWDKILGAKMKNTTILKRNKAEEDANVLLWFEGKPTKGRASEYIASVVTNYPNYVNRGDEDVRVRIGSPTVFRHKESYMVGADQNNVRKNPQKWALIIQRIFADVGENVKVVT